MNNQNFPMDVLIGHEKGAIISYFGKPVRDYPNLSIFELKGGMLAVLFSREKVFAYVLYSLKDKSVRAKGIRLLLSEPEIFEDMDAAKLIDKYGKPHVDLGSGLTVPAYLGADPFLYVLSVFGNAVKRISKISLLDMKFKK